MGLKPLEYLDCFLDAPAFRENLLCYEKELEGNSGLVKNLTKECRRLIQATEEFSKVQQSFAHSMKNFKFDIIGETQTEEEIMIAESLKLFADVLLTIEEQRCVMLSTISARMLDTLERFRKENMQQAKDEKKRFEKCSEKYYNSLEKYLSLNQNKKKDIHSQQELDSNLFKDQAAFQQASFQYACQLQDVHAAKQYELVEPILGYIGDVTTFLHQAYDTALSTRPQLEKAQFRIQLLRETHMEEQEKAYELKAKIIEEGKQGLLHHPEFIKQGFLMVQEKRIGGLTHSWTRYFCQFSKSEDVQFLRLIPLGQHNKPEFYQVKQCTRCKSDEIDRRFCIEVEMYLHRGETKKYFMQAMNQVDMKEWLEVMEGREPTYATMPAAKVTEVKMLTLVGHEFVCKCIQTLEKRGLEEEGIYRKPGVLSKASALMKDCIERGRLTKIQLDDEIEYDTKTVASAVKMYFSKQISEPLMTYALYDSLINAAKLPYDDRITAITALVNKLPSLNYKVLNDFITHLSVVACHSNYNLMQASNLGVVFGPTLIRPEVETVARINNIKYQNIIVEMMIDEKDKIFCRGMVSEVPQQTPQDASYDRLEGASVMPPSKLPKSPSEDHIVDSVPPKSTSQSSPSPSPKRKDTETSNLDSFDSKPTYAIPRRKPPRPPHTARKPPAVRSNTMDNMSTPDKDIAAATASSPVVERGLSFQHSNSPSLSTSSNEEKSPKLSQNNGNNGTVTTPTSNVADPIRTRAFTTVPTPKKSPDMATPSPIPTLEKKRLNSDSALSTIANEHLDKNDNRNAEDAPPPIPWRSGSLHSHRGGHTRARKPIISSRRARTLYDCESDDPNELSFKKGQILMDVKRSEEPGWLEATLNSKTGLVPENYIEILP